MELLVVIAIIGLLATLAFVSLNRARSQARDTVRMQDLSGITKALELYYSENERYPSSADCFCDATCTDICVSLSDDWIPDMQKHMPQLPLDPLYGQQSGGESLHYQYRSFYPEANHYCEVYASARDCFEDSGDLVDTDGIHLAFSPYLLCLVLETDVEPDNYYRMVGTNSYKYCTGQFEP